MVHDSTLGPDDPQRPRTTQRSHGAVRSGTEGGVHTPRARHLTVLRRNNLGLLSLTSLSRRLALSATAGAYRADLSGRGTLLKGAGPSMGRGGFVTRASSHGRGGTFPAWAPGFCTRLVVITSDSGIAGRLRFHDERDTEGAGRFVRHRGRGLFTQRVGLISRGKKQHDFLIQRVSETPVG